jgi:poly-gamma-glutamate synthesis protein (capsule biosynthesis protein)
MDRKIILLLGGDLLYNSKDGLLIDESLKKQLEETDFFSVNLEAPLNLSGSKLKKTGPSLSQKKEVLKYLRAMGVNFLNMSNNHIADLGKEGIEKTMAACCDFLIAGAGLSFDEAYQLKTKKIKDLNIGFLSFAEAGYGAISDDSDNKWGYAWVNHPAVDELVKDSASKTDLLIVQVHAGVEEIKIPLPEWRKRYKQLIDSGASAVIASHPHVPQGWEMYHGAPIFYSLGNLWFDYNSDDPLWNKSIFAKLTITTGIHKELRAESIPVERKGNTLFLSSDREYLSYIENLNTFLIEPVYTQTLEKEIHQLWESRYKPYYLNALNGIDKFNIIRVLKIFKRLLLGKGIQTDFLHHLLFIESHLWTVNRALSLKYKKQNING